MIYYIIGIVVVLTLIPPTIIIIKYKKFKRDERVKQEKLNESTRDLLNRY